MPGTDRGHGLRDAEGRPAPLTSLERFLEKLLEDTWLEITGNLGRGRGGIVFSGILALEDPWLLPLLDKPGVFILMGPTPALQILAVGYSQAPMTGAVHGKVQQLTGGGPRLLKGKSDPTYLACVPMDEEWTLVRPFWALLTRRIKEQRTRNR